MAYYQQQAAAPQQQGANLGQTIAANRFVLSRRIGKGGFGDVYEGCDIWTNEDCAVKLERVTPRRSYLHREYTTYQKLKSIDGIPQPVWYGTEGPFNIMVMQLLGPSLSDLMARYKRLSVCTVLKLGAQMITLLERVHNCGLLHRDIKPGNFLIGRNDDLGKLHLIDFGLAGQYRDANGRHIPYNSSAHFHGTDKYASVNSHMKIESSRRDDLESVAYTLIYLVKGELPWQYVTNKAIRRKRMGQMKMRIQPDELCAGLPRCFEELLRYAMNLEFGQDPKYSYLRGLFEQTLNATPGGWASPFEWAVPTANPNASTPLFYISPVVTELDDAMQDDDNMFGAETASPQNSSQGRVSPPLPHHGQYFQANNLASQYSTPTTMSSSATSLPPMTLHHPQPAHQWSQPQYMSPQNYMPPTSQYFMHEYTQQVFSCPQPTFQEQQFRRPSTSGQSDEMEIDMEMLGGIDNGFVTAY
eukprot:TRINITY_DN2718_c0_g1_i4.p1 TRINITY_DN2718_c0_g1~~TRINITY_DN2718_c0_g1_i4.p1  ORF type:complete len:471 (-),score=59.92 TRINITY_DN2718_c0_g1_i4:241-1653(-)